MGGNVSAEELQDKYDAVVLCCGAKQARDITAPGRDAQGIYFAVDYLTSVTRSLLDSNFADGKAVSAAGKKVLVIGGGDTGNDCVGTAIRQGCESVMQLEMMPMPPCRAYRKQRLAGVAPRVARPTTASRKPLPSLAMTRAFTRPP